MINLFSNISEVRKDEKDDLTRIWDISDASVDMHRSVLSVDNWDLEFFNRAGAFYYQHITDGNPYIKPDPNLALGPARAYVDNDKLVGVGKFEPEDKNELAGTIMFKVDYGTMRMTSVGFKPTDQNGQWGDNERGEDPEVYYFGERMLLEFSCVHVASNLSAEKKSIDSMNQYLLKQIDLHPSQSYQRDFKKRISHEDNKTIIIPKTIIETIEETGDNRTDLVRENQLFINQNFLNNV